MNAVGIDVSKGKSMVAIMRPFGEIVAAPFGIKHTTRDINSLVELIHSIEGESRIVMKHTGHYYEVLAHQLPDASLYLFYISRLEHQKSDTKCSNFTISISHDIVTNIQFIKKQP